jgi:hypothetical protein
MVAANRPHTPQSNDAEGESRTLGPWQIVWGQPYIAAAQLAAAIENDLRHTPAPDFRTRLLVRDAAQAIKSYWGSKRFREWLSESPEEQRIRAILAEDLGRPGFRHIKRRLVTTISKDQLEQVFDLLGQRVPPRVEACIAGSIPSLIQGLTVRPSDDIDFVNEVPAAIRAQRGVLNQIKTRYGLTLGHVQAHDLPANWQTRRQYFGDFGGLRVYLVDVYDVFVSKLSSKQEKHKDDLRVMAPKLDKEKARHRLLTDGRAFLEIAFDRPTIEANWKFIFREALVTEPVKQTDVKSRRGKRRGRDKGKQRKADRKPEG